MISSYMTFDIDEILEMLEEYLDKYVLLDHYSEEQLLESNVIFIEDIELECDPGDWSKFFIKKYLKDEEEDPEFDSFLRNNFVSGIFINGSMIEIELHNGKLIGMIGNRGELILRTGTDSYVFSALFKLLLQPDNAPVLFSSLFSVFLSNHEDRAGGKVSNETFNMVSGVCLMAIAKINDLPLNNYELNLSHDEMLLFGLALNLASERGDKETTKIAGNIMEQIKVYFPEIEHISPESFESPARMGQLLDFKKPGNEKERGK